MRLETVRSSRYRVGLRPAFVLCVATGLALAAGVARAQIPTAPVEGLRDASPRVHAIIGARVVPAPGKVIEPGVVVLRDGMIVAVGAEADVKVPADARVWDAKGKTIYAGFVEAQSDVHLPAALKVAEVRGEVDFATLRRGGGRPVATTVETLAPAAAARSANAKIMPERDVSKVLVADEAGAKKLRELGFTTALVTPGRRIFRGQSALVNLTGRNANATLVRGAVAQHVAFELGSFREGGYPSSLMGAIALVRQTWLDAQWQSAAEKLSAEKHVQRPEANESLAALAAAAGGTQPVVMELFDELDVARTLKIAAEFKLKLVLKGNGTEYRVAEALAKSGTAVILPLNFPAAPEVETPSKAVDVALSTLQHWELAPFNAGKLAARGVPLALTTAGLRDATQFWTNLRLAVKRGLPPDAALAAITTAPAAMFGETRVGELAPGKFGNVVVATGDLFAADSTAEITDVFVDGDHFETDAAAKVDLKGTWKITWLGSAVAGAPTELKIETRAGGPLGATASAAGAAVGAAGGGRPRARLGDKDATLTQAKNQLTLLAPAEIFLGQDAKGTVRLAGTFTDGMIAGTGLLPDGTAFRWSAERTALPVKPATPADTAKREEKFFATADAYPAGAFGRKAAPAQPTWLLVKNATVWTSGPAGRIVGGDVLVHAGKIEKIGQNLIAPAGATVIDATGKHVTAGLIDCHSHTAISRGVNEGTSAVTCEVRIGDIIDATDIAIYRELAGGLTTANVLHGSANPIGGQNQVIKLRWGADAEALKFAGAKPGVKFALGENVKRSNFSAALGGADRYPQTRMGVEQVMSDTFAQARDYERALQEWAAGKSPLPPRRNLRLEAAAEMLHGERIVHIHSYRQDEVLMFIRLAQREGLTVGTFQHILEGYKVADEIAKIGAGGSCFTDWWAYKIEAYDAIPYDGALMRAAGVVVSFNSDSNELARRMNTEAAKAVRYGGVPEDEALKFVTLNAAKQLRIADRVGSLEPGKDADFAIWSASPLSTYARCEQTWIDGRRYFDLSEDAGMRTAATKEREALVQKALTERMRAMAMAAGAAGAGARRPGGGDSPPSDPPEIIQALQRLEAQYQLQFRDIYHDGADRLNCSTHALK